jgi:hypothetical protein
MFALLVKTYGCEVWDATLAFQNGVGGGVFKTYHALDHLYLPCVN